MHKIKAHSHAVSALVEYDGLVVTGSSDARLKLWNLPRLVDPTASSVGSSGDFAQKQEIGTGKRFPIALAITKLPETSGSVFITPMPKLSAEIDQSRCWLSGLPIQASKFSSQPALK